MITHLMVKAPDPIFLVRAIECSAKSYFFPKLVRCR